MSAHGYDVIAAFPDHLRARRAADGLAGKVPRGNIRLVESASDPARVAELRAEMQQEARESVAGPGVMLTHSQARGATWGTLAGAAIGAVVGTGVGLLWAFGMASGLSEIARIAIAIIAFAAGGATMGFVAGGAMEPRVEAAEHPSKMIDAERLRGEDHTLVAVHVHDEGEGAEVIDLFERLGASRVDAVAEDGSPMAPQSEHPRPADPPGWWSNGGRNHG